MKTIRHHYPDYRHNIRSEDGKHQRVSVLFLFSTTSLLGVNRCWLSNKLYLFKFHLLPSLILLNTEIKDITIIILFIFHIMFMFTITPTYSTCVIYLVYIDI